MSIRYEWPVLRKTEKDRLLLLNIYLASGRTDPDLGPGPKWLLIGRLCAQKLTPKRLLQFVANLILEAAYTLTSQLMLKIFP